MNGSDEIGRSLARGICLGWWTLEQLDTPSQDYQKIERDRVASQNPCDARNPHERVATYPSGAGSEPYMTLPRPSMTYPLDVPPYRNLAREWINANPKEWAQLKLQYNLPPDPLIQVSCPRDFEPKTGPTPAEVPELPLTLEQSLEEAPW